MPNTLFTPVRLLEMVTDPISGFDEGLNGWIKYWPEFYDDGSMYLYVEFLDAETDNLHTAAFEVFADDFKVERNPRP